MIKIKINGKSIEVEPKTTIIQVADKVGIDIPRFCYHKKLTVAANCRMCLVEVKNFPKPLPACATQVMEGMEISTKSKFTKEAQQSVMEFLLINHPLDCPICDQGGECDLQDTAMAYGASGTRYTEEKRVVFNKNIGPLISTDLTRCIQCTRCVRFLKEVGGVMELGLVGRGEHAEISAYVDKSVESELSGNIIDLCPVGALTSKPFRYSARTWELIRRYTISPHDSLGSNLETHIKNNIVMRVLPKENEKINECWISDRDRYSYEGLNHEDRLTHPMLQKNNKWIKVEWEEAFEFITQKLNKITQSYGTDSVAFIMSPQSTLEEGFLFNKLAKSMGSSNIDYRISQKGSELNGSWLGCQVNDIETLDLAVIIGANLRQEQPLLAHRFRKMTSHGGSIVLINGLDDELLMPIKERVICSPTEYSIEILKIIKSIQTHKKIKSIDKSIDLILKKITTDSNSQKISQLILEKNVRVGIFLGQGALDLECANDLYYLSNILSSLVDGICGSLSNYANGVGLDYLGIGAPGINTKNILKKNMAAIITMNIEPDIDITSDTNIQSHLKASKFNIGITPYASKSFDAYDCLLPMSTFTESSGTYINISRQVQSVKAVVSSLAESRPAWKILRVLGNYLGYDDFNYDSTEEIVGEILPSNTLMTYPEINKPEKINTINIRSTTNSLQSYTIVRHEDSDMIVRRARALHARDAKFSDVVNIHPTTLKRLKLTDKNLFEVERNGVKIKLPIHSDLRVALNTVCYHSKYKPSFKLPLIKVADKATL